MAPMARTAWAGTPASVTGLHGLGIVAGQAVRGQGGAVQFVGARAVERQQFGAGGVVKSAGVVPSTTQRGPEKSARTASTPSSEVPDIRPMYSSETEDEFTVIRGLTGAKRLRAHRYSALACWMSSADASSVRIMAARRSNARRAAAETRCGGLALAGDGHGVLVLAVDAELKMQVRAGGPACGAHGADVFALGHRLALLHVDAAQVGVDGDVLVAVL